MKQKVLSYKNLPTKLPIDLTILAYLLLDKFNASQLIWGIAGTFIFFIWAGAIYSKINEEFIELWSK